MKSKSKSNFKKILDLFLGLLMFYLWTPSLVFSRTQTSEEARYKDFYLWKANKSRHTRELQKGAEEFRRYRKYQQDRFEQLSAEHSVKRRAQKQLNSDQKAEEWMRMQNEIYRRHLNKARTQYIQKNQASQSYKIPENEEFGIDDWHR